VTLPVLQFWQLGRFGPWLVGIPWEHAPKEGIWASNPQHVPLEPDTKGLVFFLCHSDGGHL